jgi:hypothetical protein
LLSLNILHSQSEVSQDWTTFNQTIDVQTTMPKKKKKKNLEWFLCKESIPKDPHAWAGIWASRYKDDERGFDNMSGRPNKNQ